EVGVVPGERQVGEVGQVVGVGLEAVVAFAVDGRITCVLNRAGGLPRLHRDPVVVDPHVPNEVRPVRPGRLGSPVPAVDEDDPVRVATDRVAGDLDASGPARRLDLDAGFPRPALVLLAVAGDLVVLDGGVVTELVLDAGSPVPGDAVGGVLGVDGAAVGPH